jgi:hypothetical protein
MMGMGQQMPMRRPQRPQMGPSPMTAGRPNPMAGFNAPMAPLTGPPPQVPPWAQHPQGIQAGGGGAQVAQGQPPPGGWGSGGAPGYSPPNPNVQAYTPQVNFGGGPQGMMGQFVPGAGPAGLNDPNLQSQVASMGGGPLQTGVQGQMQGMSDAMMHPFAPRNRGPQGVGPMQQMQGALGQMQGAIGGAMRPQRRFPGALGRGIMQAMAPPPQMAQPAPPAPYGGQQFRMW